MRIVGSLSSAWKRKGASWPALFGVAITLLGASCGSVPKTYYYTLQPPAPPASGDTKTTLALGVEHFRAAEMLRDDRIVYYQAPTEMNYYEHHRWGSDPATMLSELALEWVAGTGIFAQVRMLPSREPLDYVLRGRVFSFEEVDYGEASKVRVGLELTLVRSRDHKVVWSELRRVENPVQEKGMAGVVKGLNASSQQLLRDALPGLVAQVEQDYKALQEQPQ
jgi:ABC-type uncharacterized transport system auxiliary subunit